MNRRLIVQTGLLLACGVGLSGCVAGVIGAAAAGGWLAADSKDLGVKGIGTTSAAAPPAAPTQVAAPDAAPAQTLPAAPPAADAPIQTQTLDSPAPLH